MKHDSNFEYFLDITNYCPTITQPANTTATTVDYRMGMTTNFTCASGYAPGSSGSPTMTCTYYNVTTGKWSTANGSCVGVACFYNV